MADINRKSEIKENSNQIEEIQSKIEEMSFDRTRTKLNSDTTSLLSFSSENSDYHTDNEHSLSVKPLFVHKLLNYKHYSYDKDFPILNKRSNSQIYKRSHSITVVREELVEDESEMTLKRKPLNFREFRRDLDREKFVNLQSTKIRPTSAQKESNTSLTVMDPVYEVKEETDSKFEQRKVISSPRVKFLTEYKEDTITVSPRGYYNSSFMNNTNKYELETDEVIAEDNNENLVDNDVRLKKSKTSHLKISDFLDKLDTIEDVDNELQVNTDMVDPIKEENIEEDETLEHNAHHSIIPISDSFEPNGLRNLRLSLVTGDLGEAIFEEKEEE